MRRPYRSHFPYNYQQRFPYDWYHHPHPTTVAPRIILPNVGGGGRPQKCGWCAPAITAAGIAVAVTVIAVLIGGKK